MNKENNQPNIRFNDSKGEWKQWKIGELLTEKYRPILIEDEKDYQLVTVKRRNEGVISRGYLKGKNILVKNYFEVEKGDFIISKRQIIHGASGIVPQSLNKAVVSNEYLVATSNENISTEYLTLISMLPSMRKKYFLSSFGVDIEKMVFDVRDWKKRSITIPDIKEQKKIVVLFQDLDKLITQHQQKHTKLKELKQAMLIKMFPRQGQLVPDIRFKLFSEPWEKKKLGEIGKTYSGVGFPIREQGGKFGLPFYKISDMSIKGNEHEMKVSNNYVSNTQIQHNNWKPITQVPSIIFAKVGAALMLNRKRLVNVPFLIDNNTMAYLFDHSWDVYFGKALFETLDLTKYAQVGALPSYNGKDIEEIYVNVPRSLNEQIKIGNYFKNLDELIDNHGVQIIKLQNIKKAFLAKIFI